MGRLRRIPLFIPISATLLIVAAGAFGLGWQLRGRSGPDRQKVGEALERIRASYVDDVPESELTDAALRGLVDRLDPNCEYMDPEAWKRYEERQIKARYGGVGIEIEQDSGAGGLRILATVDGSPAAAAGLLKGDLILEVDGRTLQGLSLTAAVERIKGPSGSPVALTVRREERTFPVTLNRYTVRAKSVRSRLLEGGIGYVRITDFVEMMDLFDGEVDKLRAQGLKGIVIDLRFNRGGLLSECVALADRFLDDGLIVTTHSRGSRGAQAYVAGRGDTLPPLPLAVLVNEDSASASEIFAAAMQDHGRGVLVGAPTFGKGTVQTPFPLADGSRLKITTARYTTPRGASVQREAGKRAYGLMPDLRVEMSVAETAALLRNWERPSEPSARDYPLEAATEVLRAALEKRPSVAASRLLKPGERSGS